MQRLKEDALVVIRPEGSQDHYLGIIRGKGGSDGIALVEVARGITIKVSKRHLIFLCLTKGDDPPDVAVRRHLPQVVGTLCRMVRDGNGCPFRHSCKMRPQPELVSS